VVEVFDRHAATEAAAAETQAAMGRFYEAEILEEGEHDS
jgi:hypothetical protein